MMLKCHNGEDGLENKVVLLLASFPKGGGVSGRDEKYGGYALKA
jgi:hypothetical protein